MILLMFRLEILYTRRCTIPTMVISPKGQRRLECSTEALGSISLQVSKYPFELSVNLFVEEFILGVCEIHNPPSQIKIDYCFLGCTVITVPNLTISN